MFMAVIGLFLLLSFGSIPDYVNPLLWHHTLLVGIFADAVVLAGLLILIWARRALGTNWNSTAVAKEDIDLVQTGPYAFVRHPIYSGFLAVVAGTAIAYGHLAGVLIFVTCTAGLYFKALKEEALLTEKFHDAYTRYKAKTKAIVPFLL